ncbi:hypothetical protein AB0K52_12625 [Glycomyces sp. NPDC049804]|uniref:hypothetical protein n=1 Tax=Glycomyces sp. NPDC049804 TaxID=3154363 RepID=UPI003414EE0F
MASFNTVTAAFGAVGLTFGWLSLGATVTSRLPWESTVVAGIALGAIVAVPNAALAAAALRGSAYCGPLSILAGVLVVGWIVVEVAFIREFSLFQPFYAALGLSQVWLGRRIGRSDTRT